MKNFNTNQARHLYIAKDFFEIDGSSDIANMTDPGDLGLVAVKPASDAPVDAFKFIYRNGDGILTASDDIKIKNVEYLTYGAAPDIVLNKITVTTAAGVTIATDLLGKEVSMTVTIHDFNGFGSGDTYPITISIVGDSTNTASASAFYAALESALKSAIAGFSWPPFDVTSSGSGLVITEKRQQFVFSKHSADPIQFDVICYDVDDTLTWASISALTATASTVNGSYNLSDLEYFTHYERSENLREKVFPYNYTWKPLVVPADDAAYYILTLQYFYAGNAEDVQKSPKTLHIAGAKSEMDDIADAVKELLGMSTGSGSGSGSGSA